MRLLGPWRKHLPDGPGASSASAAAMCRPCVTRRKLSAPGNSGTGQGGDASPLGFLPAQKGEKYPGAGQRGIDLADYEQHHIADRAPFGTANTPARTRRRSGSWSSRKSGAGSIRRSSSCGRTPGPSSCRSFPSTSRSARSSAARTRSRASTPAPAEPFALAVTSPTRPPR